MLKRKLWRDIRGNWGAYLAVISVLVIGLMLYVSLSLTLESLRISKDNYYRDYRFADGFAQIARGPESIVDELEDIKGIDRAIGRIVQNVLVHKTSGEETTTLRLVSFTPGQPLNNFKLESGRLPAGESRELLVTPAFLAGNNYRIGDEIPLIIKGREVKFTITGTANSPEYVYEIPDGLTLTPNPKTFGVAFVPYRVLASLLGMSGQVNDVTFTLDSGTDFSSVKTQVTRMLAPYGMTRLIPRKDQLSNSMLEQELKGLEGSAFATPVIFLAVAGSILYIMLRRMVEQQRGQLGVLKAFGFTDREIIRHYLGYAFLVGSVGGLAGGMAGSALSFYLARIYQMYYNIPGLTGRFSWVYLIAGAFLSLLISLFAGYRGCRRVITLTPAEAMRPPAPIVGKKTPVEKVTFFWELLNIQARMAVRNVFRNKQRALFVVLGVAGAFSMMVASGASFDATYYLVKFQFERVEKYDLKVILDRYVVKEHGVRDSEYLDGVIRAEPLLEVPVTVNHKWLEKDIIITGLPANTRLFSLLSKDGRRVDLPRNGMVVSNQLARVLSIKEGDLVTVKSFLGDKKEKQVVVRQVIPQYVGLGAYMEIGALGDLMDMPSAASSILLSVERDKMAEVRKNLQEGRNVAAIHDKTKMKEQFEELMASSKASQFILLFFAFLTGFAIIYNVNLISLSERERELATLMVLGMTEREVGRILLCEQVFLGSLAIICGIPLSYGMLYAIVNAAGSEIYNMPLIIAPKTFFISLLGTLLFLVVAQWRMKGKIGRLSMLGVLKERE
ncbi:hypothetical protein Tfer_2291 [Thermincola ferriacetica]|uniref:ABC3 transporter permease C-terminal domain-containing protein n=1 Tax=Thermincola ferriacetica TaxID=281456 RepID=A0A0L6W0D8_9FIRM|nr:ABC transporter permease [Thermincola ferriacetica]KNZ69047.1 hypothetical protein Tfer_2291 [Thermincola ferriacetica]